MLDVVKQLDGRQGTLMMTGSGWARVQKELLVDMFDDCGLSFPMRRLGTEEKMWLQLVKDRKLACPDPLTEPGSYQIGPEWEKLLHETIQEGGSRHWYGYYQLGITLAHAGNLCLADDMFARSLACARNPWALRNRAVISQMDDDHAAAAEYLREAVAMLPEPNIAREAPMVLRKAGRPKDVIRLYNSLPVRVRAVGRLKVLLIEALIDGGSLIKADQMLSGSIELADIREGEIMLTDLWFRLQAIKLGGTGEADDPLLTQVRKTAKPPAHLAFRMN